jgi:cytochrome bd-type quinol oxidase subunit 2
VLIGTVGALAWLLLAPIAAFVTIWSWMTCDGDGGSPYSAEASPAGRFCDSSYSTPFFIIELWLPLVCALVGTVLAVHRRRLSDLGVGLAIAVGVLLVMAVFVESLPDECSDEQRRELTDARACETY